MRHLVSVPTNGTPWVVDVEVQSFPVTRFRVSNDLECLVFIETIVRSRFDDLMGIWFPLNQPHYAMGILGLHLQVYVTHWHCRVRFVLTVAYVSKVVTAVVVTGLTWLVMIVALPSKAAWSWLSPFFLDEFGLCCHCYVQFRRVCDEQDSDDLNVTLVQDCIYCLCLDLWCNWYEEAFFGEKLSFWILRHVFFLKALVHMLVNRF